MSCACTIPSVATKRRKPTKRNTQAKAPADGGETPQRVITAQVKYVLPPDLTPQYTDNLNVTHTDSEFIISFLQTEHPLLAPESDPKDLKTVNAKCVARLFVAPMRMPLFINALNQNFKRFLAAANAASQEALKKRE